MKKTTFQFNVCKHSCSSRKTVYVQHKCDTIFQVFSFKNNTKAQMRDIEAAYFARTDNIHPISESLKIKVDASYRFRMDGNNNTDISNNLYAMGNVFKITKYLYGYFCFNLCKKNGTSIQRNMSTVTHAISNT